MQMHASTWTLIVEHLSQKYLHVVLFLLLCFWQSCRLGRHAPIAKTQRDGIFRIGNKYASKVAEEPVDDWFADIGKINSHLPFFLNQLSQI